MVEAVQIESEKTVSFVRWEMKEPHIPSGGKNICHLVFSPKTLAWAMCDETSVIGQCRVTKVGALVVWEGPG